MNSSDISRENQMIEWVKEFSPALFRYVQVRVQEEAVAKDLVQETLLAAWRNRHEYNGEASPKNWLFLILKRKLIDYYRQSSRTPIGSLHHSEEEIDPFDTAGHWKPECYPQDWSARPDPTESKEFMRILSGCQDKLKPLAASVFAMKYLDDASSAEICSTLSISTNHYWVLMHRAKLQLSACLEKNWINL
jgi:RNA polymerase sigma-70 factor (TIGR02943 family)